MKKHGLHKIQTYRISSTLLALHPWTRQETPVGHKEAFENTTCTLNNRSSVKICNMNRWNELHE